MNTDAICEKCRYCGPFNIYRGDDGSEQVLPPNTVVFGMSLYMRCQAPNTRETKPISQREAAKCYPCNNYAEK